MLKFGRMTSGSGYISRTATKIYDVKRIDGRWVLEIWSVLNVAEVAVHGEIIRSDSFDTKADAVAVASAYQSLSDDYRPSEHGSRERYTTAIANAFAC